MRPRRYRHVDQRVQRKQIDLAAHQIGHTRLGDAEAGGGFRLAQKIITKEPVGAWTAEITDAVK
jgi:hypothetical protein